MSPRWNWDSPTPLAASECALPPRTKGWGAHSPAAKGVGESQFQRLEKRLALCLLCVYTLYVHTASDRLGYILHVHSLHRGLLNSWWCYSCYRILTNHKVMSECRERSQSGIGISTCIQLPQSGISPDRWSRISPALPSYAHYWFDLA